MLAATASASMVVPQNIERLEKQAGLIFVGVCTARTGLIGEHGLPVNVFTFEVREAVKGRIEKGKTIEVRQFGNDVPNARGLAIRIPGIPTYRIGDEVLLFLNPPSKIDLTAPVGLSQGVFPVVRGPEGGRWIVLDPLRRKMLFDGVDAEKYAAAGRLNEAERQLLVKPPARVEVATFCSLVRKIGEARKRLEKERGEQGKAGSANGKR